MKNSFSSISEELFLLHEEIRHKWPHITRVAIALHDADTDLLHTFIKSSQTENSINHYSFLLHESESLSKISETGEPRYLHDLTGLHDLNTQHSIFVYQNFKSSFTFPIYWGQQFLGFIFYDAVKENYFTKAAIQDLTVYTKVIESLVHSEVLPLKMLVSMFNVTHEMTHSRDSETAKHLLRMAHYMELLAVEMADEFSFTDEQIEYIWLYAPMHDIGKVVMPDKVLLKEGPLNAEERKIIETHVTEGMKIVERIATQFQFKSLYHLDLLKDIVNTHHERWNGSGYPNGLQKDEIPPVGRIAAIADVFDALAMKRIYRKAMPLEEVFQYIEDNSGKFFDPKAVNAFLNIKNKVIEVHHRLNES